MALHTHTPHLEHIASCRLTPWLITIYRSPPSCYENGSWIKFGCCTYSNHSYTRSKIYAKVIHVNNKKKKCATTFCVTKRNLQFTTMPFDPFIDFFRACIWISLWYAKFSDCQKKNIAFLVRVCVKVLLRLTQKLSRTYLIWPSPFTLSHHVIYFD